MRFQEYLKDYAKEYAEEYAKEYAEEYAKEERAEGMEIEQRKMLLLIKHMTQDNRLQEVSRLADDPQFLEDMRKLYQL